MKTWRERIAEARERGEATPEDLYLARDYLRCVVGETAMRFDLSYHELSFDIRLNAHPFVGMHPVAGAFPVALSNKCFDVAEDILDAIEDRALELKRQHQESHP
jgi:hypothetical protein